MFEIGYTPQQATDSLGVLLSSIGRRVRAEDGPTAESSADQLLRLNLSGQT